MEYKNKGPTSPLLWTWHRHLHLCTAGVWCCHSDSVVIYSHYGRANDNTRCQAVEKEAQRLSLLLRKDKQPTTTDVCVVWATQHFLRVLWWRLFLEIFADCMLYSISHRLGYYGKKHAIIISFIVIYDWCVTYSEFSVANSQFYGKSLDSWCFFKILSSWRHVITWESRLSFNN